LRETGEDSVTRLAALGIDQVASEPKQDPGLNRLRKKASLPGFEAFTKLAGLNMLRENSGNCAEAAASETSGAKAPFILWGFLARLIVVPFHKAFEIEFFRSL
jgi:hypothetical protein